MKSLKSKLMAAGAMLMVSVVMLTSASFAWFTVSTAPEIAEVKVEMTATKNLEIAKATDLTTAPSEVTSNDSATETTWGAKVTSFDTAKLDFPATVSAGKLVTVSYDANGRTKATTEATVGTMSNGVANYTADIKYGEGESATTILANAKVAAVYGVWLRSNTKLTDVVATIDKTNMVVKSGDAVVNTERVKNSVKTAIFVGDSAVTGNITLEANTPTLVKVVVYLEGVYSGADANEGLIAADVANTLSVEKLGVKFASASVDTIAAQHTPA